jgi:hypothetical protein
MPLPLSQASSSTPLPSIGSGHRSGLSTMGMITLIAVVAVVIVITLSSLRGMAVSENESHAKSLLSAIADSLHSEVFAAPPHSLEEVTKADESLHSELTDGEFLTEDGRLYLRHGYLFEWRVQEANATGEDVLMVAWPFDAGQTGNATFGLQKDGEVVVTPSSAGGWSGLENRPDQLWAK